MGAYETSVAPSSGDFQPNAATDLRDFSALQICFGSARSLPTWKPACLCVFDTLGDGMIGSDDIADFVHQMTVP
jgi:hypothetical protein